MDPEKVKLFETRGEMPVVDTEKDKQEILQNLERELANKKQELADLDSKLGYMPTEELMAKKNQLNQEVMGIESQKSALVREAASSQAEIKIEPEKPVGPETPVDDFRITIETDPNFLKKKFEEQQARPATETFLEKTNKELDDIGKEYNAKIVDVKAQAQIEQPVESSVGQFETPDQLKEEAAQNAEQIKKIAVKADPDKLESAKETRAGEKSSLVEIFSNPEAENRIKEIRIELSQTKDEIQALKEEVADREQKVKLLEKEMDKLEQDSLVAFFRNAPKLETANKRGASAVTRGMAISELHVALEKYGKIQDQGFIEKIMKKLSTKMKKLFMQAYPELFPKKAKLEKAKKPAKVKKAKSAIRGKGLAENAGMSIA